MKTLREVSKMVKITRRTLQEYNRIGLVKPSAKTEQDYWLYDDAAIQKLMLIRIYAEAGYTRAEIRQLLDSPMGSVQGELDSIIKTLEEKRKRIDGMISVIRMLQQMGNMPEDNGVYYLSYTTILGTKGRVSMDKFVRKRFLEANGETSGYITGIQLANMYGFTTQNPSCYEVCSNEASTKQRRLEIDGRQIIVYKPVTEVSKANKGALQFLDLMCTIDKYSEIKGEEFSGKIKTFITTVEVDFEQVKRYIELFPDRVYRNIYQRGLMNELT